jgi:ER lumen protein retaining receptor
MQIAVSREGAFAKVWPQSCSGISFKSQALYLIVYITRYLGEPAQSAPEGQVVRGKLTWWTDIFWTLTTGSLYNNIFKLLFLSASSYTIYLMLNDYKPTHDPNIDTFKVQYLFGASFVLAILFPYHYHVAEVGHPCNLELPPMTQKLTR